MSDILSEEKEYLIYVKEQLLRNIEHCEKELIEIPKRHTNVLQGDTFLVESLMSNVANTLRKLETAREVPYFARIDFLQDGTNKVAKLYIGKTSIIDENQELATIDWRTPICSLYYDSEVGKVSYEAPAGTITGELQLKRQIIIEKGEVVSAKDTALVAQDELLQSYLNVHADNRMKNIVASIQKEQHKIIRMPLKENIIVQGVAGSGKTSVALHRIAYLVYNENKTVQADQFLVIGPNKYFLDYISSLLPDLEVDSITQLTFLDIAEDIIGEKIKLTDINQALEQYFKTKKIDPSLAYKSSLDYKAAVDRFIAEFVSSMVDADVKVGNATIIRSKDIKAEFEFQKGNSLGTIFDNFQKKRITRIKDEHEALYDVAVAPLWAEARSLEKNDPRKHEIYRKIEEIRDEFKTGCKKTIQTHFKKATAKPLAIYKEFISNIEKYITLPVDFNIEEFKSKTLKNISKKTLEYEDLAAVMYIKLIFLSRDDYKGYREIVLDEAQDLGLFHFTVLKQLFSKGSFSIFGDLNQAVHSYSSISSWEELNDKVFDSSCTLTTLDRSYRTTEQIMEAANCIPEKLDLHVSDSLVREGKPVSYIDVEKLSVDEVIMDELLKITSNGHKSIAIISKTDEEAKSICEALKTQGMPINYISGKDDKYLGGICSITSYNSKGLEFDAVIITDASEKAYSSERQLDLQLLYVAMTRPLHELVILYKNQITNVLKFQVEKSKTSNKNLD